MYFKNRSEAGKLLAEELGHYAYKNTVVLALSEGACIVGSQIAIKLHTNLFLFLVKDIVLPNDKRVTASVSSVGTFRYNDSFSAGEIEEIESEYRGYIEQERIKLNHELNTVIGMGGEVKKEYLRHRNIIVVSDGLITGFSFHMAADFLNTISIQKVIVATPLATIEAVDQLHALADEVHVLTVPANFLSLSHYYEDNTPVDADAIDKLLTNTPLLWQN